LNPLSGSPPSMGSRHIFSSDPAGDIGVAVKEEMHTQE